MLQEQEVALAGIAHAHGAVNKSFNFQRLRQLLPHLCNLTQGKLPCQYHPLRPRSLFSTPSPAFIACRLLDRSHSDWCEMVPHCGFHLQFFFGEMSVQFFDPFFDWSFIFLELNCRSCLYIFEINYLSFAYFAIILCPLADKWIRKL